MRYMNRPRAPKTTQDVPTQIVGKNVGGAARPVIGRSCLASYDAPQYVWSIHTQGLAQFRKLAHLKPTLPSLEFTDVAG